MASNPDRVKKIDDDEEEKRIPSFASSKNVRKKSFKNEFELIREKIYIIAGHHQSGGGGGGK